MAGVTYFSFKLLSSFINVTAIVTGVFAIWALYVILIHGCVLYSAIVNGDFVYASPLVTGSTMPISTVSPDFVNGARSNMNLKVTTFEVVLPVVIFAFLSGNIIGCCTLIPNPVEALVVTGLPILANLLLLLGSTAAASAKDR